MKPGDFFIGVIDFFSSFIPGAIAAFLMLQIYWDNNTLSLLINSDFSIRELQWASPEGWAVFLITAYVLGHIISAAGSFFLDALYKNWVGTKREGKFYKHLIKHEEEKKAFEFIENAIHFDPTEFTGNKNEIVRHIAQLAILAKEEPLDFRREEKLLTLIDSKFRQQNVQMIELQLLLNSFVDEMKSGPLLMAAKKVKEQQLQTLAKRTNVDSLRISNTFYWALSYLRHIESQGTQEVLQLSGQSKLFRSITIILIFLSTYFLLLFGSSLFMEKMDFYSLILLGISSFSIWLALRRFYGLRHNASMRAYEFFIIATLPVPELSSSPKK